MINSNEIIKKLENKLSSTSMNSKSEHVGEVVSNNDGVVQASGLSRVTLGEMVVFDKGESGFILNLGEDNVSIILLGSSNNIKEGDRVKSTGEILSINVNDDIIGRVINPIGKPLDGKSNISRTGSKKMPLEKIAAGVTERSPVDTPLKTGVKAIDTMIPVGRGQRELIIGDRGLGKTAIAIDTIINQRNQQKGQKRVICIYVAIGQKQSSVSQVIEKLKKEKAFDYTIVVAAGASDPASLQYLAPYAGTSIAEYFMEKGEDVLVVYDDLTKHAWSYRELSLVLKRPAGREAYPGDIFYLHSRLLERSVRLNDENKGGSITSLPIIETQASDISAYIPTNVISITDGQIYLQADLFNLGIRPAINPGNSVSRVGGAAQTKGIKSVSGKLRLELAQYNALAAFAQFGSELDEATTRQLERGKRSVEILKQPQYEPLSEALEIISIWSVTNGYLDNINVDEVSRFEKELHEFAKTNEKKLIERLNTGEKIDDATMNNLKKMVEDFKKGFTANN